MTALAAALLYLGAGAASSAAAQEPPPEPPPQTAGYGAEDYSAGGTHLTASASNSGEEVAVEAESNVRITDLVPVGNTERSSFVGPASGGGGAVAPRPVIDCRYEPTGRTDAAGRVEMSVMCGGSALGVYDNSRTEWVTPADPATPAAAVPQLVDPAVLAASARSQMVFPGPVPRSSPEIDEGTYARLPTAFWVEGWAPVSESATAGPVTATVTAQPLRQEWTIRDRLRATSDTVSCDGPGDAGVPAGDVEPACGWTPAHSSAGQPSTTGVRDEACFETTVTVTWAVTWASTLGPGGSLGTGTSSTDTCLIVAEIQAVVTGAA